MKILSTIQSKSHTLNELMVVFGGITLLFAASQIEIPLKPVPITLQTVAVMLIGLTYTPRHALQSILIWLGLVAAGFPLLSGFSGGIACLVGPTAGYLAGFVVSASLMAILKQKFFLNSWISDVLLCLMGTAILFSLGIAWLSHLVGFENAILHGVLPFILPGIVKAGLLCTALQIIRYYKRG